MNQPRTIESSPSRLNSAMAAGERLPGALLAAADTFPRRHLGPSEEEQRQMLALLGHASLDELAQATVPEAIRLRKPLVLRGADETRGEFDSLAELQNIAQENQLYRSFIGLGYSDTITPPVIQRNILENPGWYTQYTPYQAEISQGRLEALLNFQTMIADLTGLPLVNASLLDEGTAAAEAMAMCRAIKGAEQAAFFVAADCHPQTIAVVQTRARSMGIKAIVGDPRQIPFSSHSFCGVLVQYPTTDGRIVAYGPLADQAHQAGALLVVAADLLALTLLEPPGEFSGPGSGADIAVGSAQRFGVPMGFGGPHAAFMATRNEFARKMPGRIVGVSKDAQGHPAYRLAIQTREQHIKRDKATSNICTAQVLLAIMAGMYGVYHGPEGLRRIARRVHACAALLARGIERLGHRLAEGPFFDTLRVNVGRGKAQVVINAARSEGINLRDYPQDDASVGVAVDETAEVKDLQAILEAFAMGKPLKFTLEELAAEIPGEAAADIENRRSPFLTHPVFNRYHSETEMLRYIKRLESRDLSLAVSMISLGSCTMKLNATSQMLPVTWPQFARMHPLAPAGQARGYARLFDDLERWLGEITGLPAVSLQPNAGSQGEYAGLLAIRGFHESRGQRQRTICLIPESAHGTNPASAVIAGLEVVVVACDERGNVDVADLQAKADQHADRLAALMITYPSTRGVFEESVGEICRLIHQRGGQVYMDGANMNAQVGLCRPGDIGADVCHLNLHKTFCIPHGGGGPGMGPICAAEHLRPFLPPVSLDGAGQGGDGKSFGPVSSAAYGSASILPISWMYIAMMGGSGLTRATQVAILNANYMAKRLEGHYEVLFVGKNGRVAHEFVADCRPFEASAGIKVEDIAKRLMDYGFHAPTMSWPVPGTLMIEPTESESKAELDRFCDALIAIREEIRAVEEGRADRQDNVLKNAPHTALALAGEWKHPYSREQAAYPASHLREFKFWPAVGRIDNPYGDRHLVCTCPPLAAGE